MARDRWPVWLMLAQGVAILVVATWLGLAQLELGGIGHELRTLKLLSVGMSRAEVTRRLGKPRWSDRDPDTGWMVAEYERWYLCFYYRVDVYFDDRDRVAALYYPEYFDSRPPLGGIVPPGEYGASPPQESVEGTARGPTRVRR